MDEEKEEYGAEVPSLFLSTNDLKKRGAEIPPISPVPGQRPSKQDGDTKPDSGAGKDGDKKE